MKSLGKRIKSIRTQNNDSQKNLADKLNVSRQLISKWETGTSKPDHAILHKVANIYNVEFDYFIDNPDQTSNINDSSLNILNIVNSKLFSLSFAFFNLLVVYFLGPFSLLISIPSLIIYIMKKRTVLIVFYTILVFFGFYILVTVMFPGLLPYSIDIKVDSSH